jgi:hypothetical protein
MTKSDDIAAKVERLTGLLARYSMNVGENEGSFFTESWQCREISEEEGREIDAIRSAFYAALVDPPKTYRIDVPLTEITGE